MMGLFNAIYLRPVCSGFLREFFLGPSSLLAEAHNISGDGGPQNFFVDHSLHPWSVANIVRSSQPEVFARPLSGPPGRCRTGTPPIPF